MKTEAWWVCRECGKAIQKVGKSGGQLHNQNGHRKVCPESGYRIEQIPQDELTKRKA